MLLINFRIQHAIYSYTYFYPFLTLNTLMLFRDLHFQTSLGQSLKHYYQWGH